MIASAGTRPGPPTRAHRSSWGRLAALSCRWPHTTVMAAASRLLSRLLGACWRRGRSRSAVGTVLDTARRPGHAHLHRQPRALRCCGCASGASSCCVFLRPAERLCWQGRRDGWRRRCPCFCRRSFALRHRAGRQRRCQLVNRPITTCLPRVQPQALAGYRHSCGRRVGSALHAASWGRRGRRRRQWSGGARARRPALPGKVECHGAGASWAAPPARPWRPARLQGEQASRKEQVV